MRRIALLLFIGLLINSTFSQSVTGRVVDNSNQPLPGASVYYEGTTIATVTNDNGEFSIAYNNKLARPLVVSYIGLETYFIQDYSVNQHLLISMKLAVNKLREVVIRKDRFSRIEKMKIFKERFIGTTAFGKKTSIQNESEIEFEYDEETFVLKAYSDKPLVIVNPSLGYKINYELYDFEIKFSRLSISSHDILQSYYAGISQYQEIKSNIKIIKHREEAYKGSTVNFYRNLIYGDWSKKEFQLFSQGYIVNPADYFTLTFENDQYKVDVKKQKSIANIVASYGLTYNQKEKSQVIFTTETIYVDQFGNNQTLRGVSFSGAISEKRVGEMLPLNYGM